LKEAANVKFEKMFMEELWEIIFSKRDTKKMSV